VAIRQSRKQPPTRGIGGGNQQAVFRLEINGSARRGPGLDVEVVSLTNCWGKNGKRAASLFSTSIPDVVGGSLRKRGEKLREEGRGLIWPSTLHDPGSRRASYKVGAKKTSIGAGEVGFQSCTARAQKRLWSNAG